MNDTSVFERHTKKKDYLICIDSDGCVFDSMEVKHKDCFAPNFIKHWELQNISEYALEVWVFVNLYSRTRGCNRFQALVLALDLLAERPEVIESGYRKPDITSLRNWIEKTTALSNARLEEQINLTDDDVLKQVYRWSLGINQSVENMSKGVPPFPSVRKAIEKASDAADLMVVSATPFTALEREWQEHDLVKYMAIIAGQELGTKADHIAAVKADRYENHKVLKIGDAPGDYEAAKQNKVLFFPIVPGNEEESWKRFFNEALDRFISGRFSGDYQKELITEYYSALPELPSWS